MFLSEFSFVITKLFWVHVFHYSLTVTCPHLKKLYIFLAVCFTFLAIHSTLQWCTNKSKIALAKWMHHQSPIQTTACMYLVSMCVYIMIHGHFTYYSSVYHTASNIQLLYFSKLFSALYVSNWIIIFLLVWFGFPMWIYRS